MSIVLDPEEVRRWWTEANDDPRRMAEIAIRVLTERAVNGDVNAQVVLNDWTVAGAIQRLKPSRQTLRQVIVPRKGKAAKADGKPDVAALPVVMSVPVNGGHQLKAWDTLTYADFGLYVQDYRAHHRTRTDVLRTLERILSVWSEHPDVMGSEALALAGIDPETLRETVAV